MRLSSYAEGLAGLAANDSASSPERRRVTSARRRQRLRARGVIHATDPVIELPPRE